MADLTFLTSLEPIPIYPSLPNNNSRTNFSTYLSTPHASTSKVQLVPSPGNSRRRPKPEPLDTRQDFRGKGKVYAERREGAEENALTTPTTSSSARPRSPSRNRSNTSPTTGYPKASPHHQISFGEDVLETSGRGKEPFNEEDTDPIPVLRVRRRGHRPNRSHSAPPERTTFDSQELEPPAVQHDSPTSSTGDQASSAGYGSDFWADTIPLPPHRPRRGFSYNSSPFSEPLSSWSPSEFNPRTPGGELLKPPPPLHRPRTFWRRTQRSGVTSSSFSPASHLIRRSTFVAAGLPCEKSTYDLSAQGVESRMKSENSARLAKVQEIFWEVIS